MNIEEYIYKAEKVFLTEGFYDFSMEWLAEKIGTTKRTLYNNFYSREDLIKSIIDLRKERIKASCLPMFSEYGKDTVDIFKKWIEENNNTTKEYNRYFIPSLKEKFPDYYLYLIHSILQHCKEFLSLLIPRGRDEGIIMRNFNIDSYATFVCNSLVYDYTTDNQDTMYFLIRSICTEQGLRRTM